MAPLLHRAAIIRVWVINRLHPRWERFHEQPTGAFFMTQPLTQPAMKTYPLVVHNWLVPLLGHFRDLLLSLSLSMVLKTPKLTQQEQMRTNKPNQPESDYKHLLTFCVRRCVVMATKPVHRLQIRPILQTRGYPLPFSQVTSGSCAVVWECGEGQTGTQTAVATIHFVSVTPHAKCKYRPTITYEDQLLLTKLRNALHPGERAANE